MKKCPFCAESIQIEAIKCRYCGERVQADTHSSKHPLSAEEQQVNALLKRYPVPDDDDTPTAEQQTNETKICSFCAEAVNAAAIKCKHCGSALTGQEAMWAEYRQRYSRMSEEERRVAWKEMSPQQRFDFNYAGLPRTIQKSNGVAFFLGLLFGPVGLWYKGQWMAGFAWVLMTFILSAATALIAAPFCWLGMAIHAAVAEPRE